MSTIQNNKFQNFHKLIQHLSLYRWQFIALLHLSLFSLAYVVAFLIRFDNIIPEHFYATMLKSLPFFVFVQGFFFYYHDLYQGLWKYVGFSDTKIILKAIFLSLVTLLIFDMFLAPYWGIIPRSIYILDGLLVASFVLGARLMVRQFRHPAKSLLQSKGTRRMLLLGPIEVAEPLLREMMSRPHEYLPVAVIEPTKHWHGMRLLNIPIVGGLGDLPEIVERYLVQEVLIAWPNAPQNQINDVISECKRFQLSIKIVPSLVELLDGQVRLADVRDIEIEDLLPRPPVDIDRKPIADFMINRVVLVTGAGGTIGSEICRQIAGYPLRRLILLERAENALSDLEIAIKQQFPALQFEVVVGSINDGPGLYSLFQKYRPDLVFHGAAYKHVPLMERYPLEAAYNNILGTRNLVKAALDTGTERFVLISTDKAVNPTSVMGVSKRIAERYIYSLNGSQSTQFLITRFGNVLGSAGSVMQIFRNQIFQGGPVTVTHPEIKRFFMTIQEAVQLVLQAAYMGKGGDIFVLNMGRSVRIRELADKLCLLAGKTPGKDVDIIYTGLRPGEKMYEELFNADERAQATEHPLILRALGPKEEESLWEGHLEEIAALVRNRDVAGLLAKFHDIVADYQGHQIPQAEN